MLRLDETEPIATLATALSPTTVFAWLLGSWCFSRAIAGQATMQGCAWVVRIDSGAAIYRERVAVELAEGTRLTSSQAYRFHALPLGFQMCFAETGALFQELRFVIKPAGVLVARAEHLCRDDLYKSIWRIMPQGRFEVRHEVRGPRKQYLIESVYWRAK